MKLEPVLGDPTGVISGYWEATHPSDDFAVWQFDLNPKYWVVMCTADFPPGFEDDQVHKVLSVTLCADPEHYREVDVEKGYTPCEIKFNVPSEDFAILAECSRYTATVVLYRDFSAMNTVYDTRHGE